MPAILLSLCPSLGQPPGIFDEIARYHVALIIGGVVYLLLAVLIVWVEKERYALSQRAFQSSKEWRNLFWSFNLICVQIMPISLLQFLGASWWSDLRAWRDGTNLYAKAASSLHCPFTPDLAAYNGAIPVATALWVSGGLLSILVLLLLWYTGQKRRKLEKSLITA